MIAKFGARLVQETDARILWKFVANFGFKGMRAVQRFEKRLKRGEVFPAFLFISVTSRCNLRCQGCWASPDAPGRQLETETINNIINAAKSRGVYTFGILGGEPLLHRGLFDVLAEHPDCYFLLFTNGTLIDEKTAITMRRLGNISPLISVEGSQEISDVRRGGNDVLQRTMEGIKYCREQRLVIGVATSVCKSNLDDLATESFVSAMADEGVHYLWYYVYRPVGPLPQPELALSPEEVTRLRRFMVDVRSRARLLVVDSYWDHNGRAMCPAAVGIGHHIGPGGDLEVCPPIQFAAENVSNGCDIADVITNSEFLKRFRTLSSETTRGCIIMERPDLLADCVDQPGTIDSSGRGTGLDELRMMTPRCSHHVPGHEIPETSWPYRFAKKNWFFGFGAYG